MMMFSSFEKAASCKFKNKTLKDWLEHLSSEVNTVYSLTCNHWRFQHWQLYSLRIENLY
jgi:hypothetical protein